MAKALGAEIMEFYDHHWPEGYYHDDSQIEFHDQNPPRKQRTTSGFLSQRQSTISSSVAF